MLSHRSGVMFLPACYCQPASSLHVRAFTDKWLLLLLLLPAARFCCYCCCYCLLHGFAATAAATACCMVLLLLLLLLPAAWFCCSWLRTSWRVVRRCCAATLHAACLCPSTAHSSTCRWGCGSEGAEAGGMDAVEHNKCDATEYC